MSHLFLTAVGGDPSETVQLGQDSTPAVGAEDVLVAVDAAPINPADLLFTLGWFGVYPQVPNALGAEGTGRVLQVGAAADPNLVGRRVIILPTFVQGTWADAVVVPAQNVFAVTENADPLQLAMLPVNPATAYALLNDYADLKPGDWVGLNLANSGVGQYVVPLARRRGIKTLAVVRREEAAKRVRELGADLVVVDGPHLGDRAAAALGDNRLRLLFEGTGGPEQVGELIRSVEAGGSVVAFSAVTGQPPVVPLADLIYRGISLRAFFILNWIRDTSRPELERIYTELAELVAEGAISATVEATYPLNRYREALAHAGQEERSGKILFTPGRQTA